MPPHLFLDLPAELVLLTMTHLETPRDLWAFIRASKRGHQLFRQNQEMVLKAILKNAMPGENLHIAIAACKASEVSRLWWAGSSPKVVAESLAQFFNSYPRCYAPDLALLRDRSLQRSLCKLWWTSDYFVSCSEQDALAFAALKLPSPRREWVGDLKRSEFVRLQRAFFRFEVYRRISPGTMDRSVEVPNDVYENIFDFLKWFSPWEREEILSIQEFLVRFTKALYKELQDYIIVEISTVAKEWTSKSEDLQRPLERESIAQIRTGLELGHLDIFQPYAVESDRRFQYMVARGLPFIRWLSKLPPNDRIRAMVTYSIERCDLSLFEALSELRHDMNRAELAAFDTGINRQDGTILEARSAPSEGWIWADKQGLTTGEESLRVRYVLRRMGYVFWDTARLNEHWQLQLTSASMLNLHPRHRDDNDLDWIRGPGVAEHFKDIPVPKGAFSRKDSGICRRLAASKAMMDKTGGGYPTPFSDEEARLFDIEY